MSEVRLENVSRVYDRVTAVDDVSLTVAEGQFLTLLGPSGCGKTTTLRMIAGFLQPTAGTIYIKGEDVTRVPANRRDTGMVFQTYALFPHMSVAANVAFGLKMRGIRGEAAAVRVRDALRVVQLESMADRLPRQLSGGQQQRVALARAVVIRPQVLLMDEPLGSLDLKLRQELQIQIRSVQQQLGITAIYVTHDQGEALSMSDRVAVMRNGRVEQLDQPDRLYSRPVSAFVANFVGRTNLLAAEVVEVSAAQSLYKVRSTDAPDLVFSAAIADAGREWRPGDRCLVGFRPENGVLGSTAENRIGARVRDVRYFGATRSVSLTNALGGSFDIDVSSETSIPARGEPTDICWRPSCCFLLPPENS